MIAPGPEFDDISTLRPTAGGPLDRRPAGRPRGAGAARPRRSTASGTADDARPAGGAGVPAPRMATGGDVVRMRHTGEQAILLAVDIVGFGAAHRHDEVLKAMRAGLYDALHAAFANSGIDMERRYFWQDRGGGALYVMPPTISPGLFVDPLIDELSAELRAYNRCLNDLARIRLRVALHVGNVHFDDYGVTGLALTRLFNLLNAQDFTSAFGGLDTDLGFVTSDRLFEDVIRHGSGRIEPADYHPIEIRDSDAAQWGWMYFPQTAEVFSLRPQPVAEARNVTRLAQQGC